MMKICVTALLVVVLVNQTAAQEIAIVFPAEYENTEAPGAATAGDVILDGYRMQGIFDSSIFASLPASHQTLTGIYMRPDGLIGTANSISYRRLTFKLSTTSVTPTNLKRVFAANVGPDEAVVYDGPISFTTANTGPRGGPKDFDIAYQFQTPFQYDPTQGNLLMDWTVYGPASWTGDDEVLSTLLSKWSYGSGPDAVNGSFFPGSPVISFRFVPEPTSFLITAVGFFGLTFFGSRRGIART
jgi:hypothetical protein